MSESCESCRFWLRVVSEAGICRRYPKPLRKEPSEWCGEWSPNDEWFEPQLHLTEPDDESPDENLPSGA